MKNPDGPVPEPRRTSASSSSLTVPSPTPCGRRSQVLEPDSRTSLLGRSSLAWDEAPESASERLQKAIAKADRGRGVVLLTDMFGGTPSNLALAFLQKGRIEIVTGVNLPMVVKATRPRARRERTRPRWPARSSRKGRRAIVAAGELMETEKRTA